MITSGRSGSNMAAQAMVVEIKIDVFMMILRNNDPLTLMPVGVLVY